MKSKKSKSVIPMASQLKNILIEWFEINSYQNVVCDINGYLIDSDIMSILVKK